MIKLVVSIPILTYSFYNLKERLNNTSFISKIVKKDCKDYEIYDFNSNVSRNELARHIKNSYLTNKLECKCIETKPSNNPVYWAYCWCGIPCDILECTFENSSFKIKAKNYKYFTKPYDIDINPTI